ncbi:MAG: hypothetical protein R3330_12990, partial [Saprospiraceae bacterium]|nr:hypothetical protein [Saprospiraceae bacterium]
DELLAIDHSGVIWRRNLHEELGYSERLIRLRWGGARIKDRYRWADWKGEIDIRNGIINHFTGYGFEHNEETCYRKSRTSLGFRSDTYGDADSIVMDVTNIAASTITVRGTIDGYVKVGNPLDGNPFAHCPEFELQFSGAELLERSVIRKELGGTELFIAVERMSEAPLPRDVSGTLQINPENGPHGFRPVYLMGRQLDDAKAWASAMFIEF